MSATEKQMLIDVNNMFLKLCENERIVIKDLAEQMLNAKLLAFAPDAILKNMDVTEKIMLIDYYSKSEEERQKDRDLAIPFEEILKKEGLTENDLQY